MITKVDVLTATAFLLTYLIGMTIFLAILLATNVIILPAWWTTSNALSYRICDTTDDITTSSKNSVAITCHADHGTFAIVVGNRSVDIPSFATSQQIQNELNTLYESGGALLSVSETFNSACIADGQTWHISNTAQDSIEVVNNNLGNTQGCARIYVSDF